MVNRAQGVGTGIAGLGMSGVETGVAAGELALKTARGAINLGNHAVTTAFGVGHAGLGTVDAVTKAYDASTKAVGELSVKSAEAATSIGTDTLDIAKKTSAIGNTLLTGVYDAFGPMITQIMTSSAIMTIAVCKFATRATSGMFTLLDDQIQLNFGDTGSIDEKMTKKIKDTIKQDNKKKLDLLVYTQKKIATTTFNTLISSINKTIGSLRQSYCKAGRLYGYDCSKDSKMLEASTNTNQYGNKKLKGRTREEVTGLIDSLKELREEIKNTKENFLNMIRTTNINNYKYIDEDKKEIEVSVKGTDLLLTDIDLDLDSILLDINNKIKEIEGSITYPRGSPDFYNELNRVKRKLFLINFNSNIIPKRARLIRYLQDEVNRLSSATKMKISEIAQKVDATSKIDNSMDKKVVDDSNQIVNSSSAGKDVGSIISAMDNSVKSKEKELVEEERQFEQKETEIEKKTNSLNGESVPSTKPEIKANTTNSLNGESLPSLFGNVNTETQSTLTNSLNVKSLPPTKSVNGANSLSGTSSTNGSMNPLQQGGKRLTKKRKYKRFNSRKRHHRNHRK